MVTRKTLVGLKKHMEVCQKVRLPQGLLWGGAQSSFSWVTCLQLQDALKCQHCRKQFKSKAGLNYHTMAEHSAKVRHRAQLPSSLPTDTDHRPALHLTHPASPAHSPFTPTLPAHGHLWLQLGAGAQWGWGTEAGPAPQPSDTEASEGSEQEERERLRKVLKQMGRLRCPQEVSGTTGGTGWGEAQPLAGLLLTCDPQGCGAAFSSLMGYQYHQQRCGKPPCEVDSPSFPCAHCGKTYRSKAGHDYHVRSEHTAPVSGQSCPSGTEHVCPPLVHAPLPTARAWLPAPAGHVAPVIHLGLLTLQPPEEPQDKPPEAEDLLGVERTPSGRIRRTSAQVAVFHLQEIAEDELARDWTKRRMKDDLVPETARVSAWALSRMCLHVGFPVMALPL